MSTSTQGVAIINGEPTPAPVGAVAWKYADPTEDGRWLYSEEEIAEVESEDPSLIVRVSRAWREARA